MCPWSSLEAFCALLRGASKVRRQISLQSNQTCSNCNEERWPSDKHLFRPLDKDSAANLRRVREVMDHMRLESES